MPSAKGLKTYPMDKLLLATGNRDKLKELKDLLEDIPLQIVVLKDLGLELDAKETGSTYRENAVIKALSGARASGLLTLADDSGLEVEALGGEPGVRSARYAGEKASNEDRIKLLLSRMEGVPREKRNASFQNVIALVKPDGNIVTFTGICKGVIALEPAGNEGFGYDPVFFFPGLKKTMAELNMEEKNKLSHRAMAIRKAKKWLLQHYSNTEQKKL